ncbi:MAG: substrate-binding domain-containing protein [Methylibium sp.]|uniref:substrate-binding domain-containing protein n=1 Tax=Methylibium sp. TaxID=2067992 RepID=UPI0017D4C323|nr:substrate-binding domain-containing protein [Methylibium sp.]MBA3599162.1 substrate-binding domain-containing protein [Methylibium sp.]
MSLTTLPSSLAWALRTTLFCLIFALALPTPARAETIRLGGTGAALRTMTVLAQAYMKVEPSFQLEIVPNLGSSGGIKALTTGATQIAVASRGTKAEERAAGVRAFEYGRTAFVLATAKDNVRALTLTQVADLYAGRQTKWSDGQPVRLVLRPASDVDTPLLASFSPSVKEALATAMAREGMVTAMTDQDSADAIERLPGGLGTSSLALLMSEHRRARALPIDGVEPTVGNVASGRYRYVKPLYLLFKDGAPASVVRFIAFVGSDAGRRILTETGTDVTTAGIAPAAATTAQAAR